MLVVYTDIRYPQYGNVYNIIVDCNRITSVNGLKVELLLYILRLYLSRSLLNKFIVFIP